MDLTSGTVLVTGAEGFIGSHLTEALLRDLRGAMAGEHQWPTQEELMAEAARLKTLSEDDPVETLPGDFIMLARVFATLGGLYAAYRPDGLGDRLRAAMLRALA